MKTSESRNKALDGVRGIAILAVVFFHIHGICSDLGQPPAPGRALEKAFAAVFAEGWAGVDLFFVLSGFLITSILLRSRAQEKYFFNFYMRRALRIFPLYYLFLVVYFLILPALFPGAPPFHGLGARQWWYWSYTSNFEVFLKGRWLPPAHCWSLAIEEQFYWLWPVLIFIAPLPRLKRITLAVLLSQPLMRLLLIRNGFVPDTVPAFTFAHLDGLMAGGLIALFWSDSSWSLQPRRLREWRRCGFSLLAAGLSLRLSLPLLPFAYGDKRAILGVFGCVKSVGVNS